MSIVPGSIWHWVGEKVIGDISTHENGHPIKHDWVIWSYLFSRDAIFIKRNSDVWCSSVVNGWEILTLNPVLSNLIRSLLYIPFFLKRLAYERYIRNFTGENREKINSPLIHLESMCAIFGFLISYFILSLLLCEPSSLGRIMSGSFMILHLGKLMVAGLLFSTEEMLTVLQCMMKAMPRIISVAFIWTAVVFFWSWVTWELCSIWDPKSRNGYGDLDPDLTSWQTLMRVRTCRGNVITAF